MSGRRRRVRAVAAREFESVVAAPAYRVAVLAFLAAVVAVAWTADAAGYLAMAVDLLVPVEVLVPALALALGARAVRGDRSRGELDVVRTYPVTRAEYVAGVYLGRLAVLLVAVLVGVGLAGALAATTTGASVDVLASYGAADSPLYVLRLAVVAAAYAAVALALVVAVVSGVRRRGLAAAVVALGAVLVAGDAAGAAGLLGGPLLAAASPATAFRALALASLGPAGGTAALAPAAVAGLAVWLVGSLLVAVNSAW